MNTKAIITNAIRFLNDHVIECDFNTGCGKCDEARVIKQSLESLLQEQVEEKEPDLDFRRDIAEELSRDQLIDRLCDMQKHYVEMRQEWFAVVHLGEKPLKKFTLLKESESITSSDTIPVTQSGKELREDTFKKNLIIKPTYCTGVSTAVETYHVVDGQGTVWFQGTYIDCQEYLKSNQQERR